MTFEYSPLKAYHYNMKKTFKLHRSLASAIFEDPEGPHASRLPLNTSLKPLHRSTREGMGPVEQSRPNLLISRFSIY